MDLADRVSNASVYEVFAAVLGLAFVLVKVFTFRAAGTKRSAEFESFQRRFLATYLLMTAADWLQGPTVYALYKYYGFSHSQNATLFVTGFASSMIFGTFAGTLADKYGRKLNCLLYGLAYGFCCVTKHFNSFPVLFLGRVAGGFATSILWSAFESWMVAEHRRRKFAPEWMGSTFSMMVTGNGFIAILSGFAAQGAVSLAGGHPVAPFDLSIALLVIGTLSVLATWSENYGDQQGSQFKGLGRALRVVREDRKVMLLGLLQSLFEGSMYTFVFAWTPVLETTGAVPHGMVFATFMVCCSLGGSFTEILRRRWAPEVYMQGVFLVAAVSMVGVFVGETVAQLLGCFCMFEMCVGIFWPSVMGMRAKYVPEDVRATVMNLFRVPLNAFVCTLLMLQGSLTLIQNFQVCSGVLLVCAVLQWALYNEGKRDRAGRVASMSKPKDE
eukprot:Hpha_TRINITY_DN9652_c0_g1::TRINITY_DN9652_c0_g1_i1::g.184472::m.184472